MKTINVALRPQEDSAGVFWRLHIEREDGSGFSEAYSTKPDSAEIESRCTFANNNNPCNVAYEHATI
jgi:hypothetical protein